MRTTATAAEATDSDSGAHADPESVARTIVLKRLAAQPRTRSELAETLAKRLVPGEVAARVLDRFEEVGLIDDAAFARSWVESRHTGRGLARRALAQELHRRGVAAEVARDALEEIDPESEVESARGLVRRKLRSTRGLEESARVRRLSGMLARRGYPAATAFHVVREEINTEGSELDDLLDRGGGET